jgi:hypothetical protein
MLLLDMIEIMSNLIFNYLRPKAAASKFFEKGETFFIEAMPYTCCFSWRRDMCI